MKLGLLSKAVYLGLALTLLFPLYAVADTENDSAAGCQAVQVDPESSLEMQQAICGAAEQATASSCASAGLGLCSSPKTNDVMPEGTNCICLAEIEETLVTL